MSDPEQTQDTPQNDKQASANPSQPDTSQGQNDGNASTSTFTQDDVNALVGKTRQEARQAAQKALLEDLGLDSVDGLKSLVEDARKRKEAEMSEADKLQAQLDAANKKAQEAEQRILEMQQAAVQTQRQSLITSALSKAGTDKADKLYLLLQADKPDVITSLFDEESTASTTDARLQSFIKQVQSDYDFFFASAGAGSPSTSNGIAPVSKQAAIEQAKKAVKQKHGKL